MRALYQRLHVVKDGCLDVADPALVAGAEVEVVALLPEPTGDGAGATVRRSAGDPIRVRDAVPRRSQIDLSRQCAPTARLRSGRPGPPRAPRRMSRVLRLDLDRLASRRVYLDANVSIYASEAMPPYAAVLTPRPDAVTGEVTMAEGLAGPFRRADPAGEQVCLVALDDRGSRPVAPVSRAVPVGAARLRAPSRLKLPDEVHGMNDVGFASASGAEVLRRADAP